MTLICSPITHKDPNFVMETQLIDDSSFLYEWKTAEEDLDFLDYTYCFEGKMGVLSYSVIFPAIFCRAKTIVSSGHGEIN